MIKLFYSPPKWFAFVAPEYIDDMYHVENRLNEKAYAEAKANALEVGNVESIKIGDIQENGAFIFPHEVQADRDYDWKGSAVIKDGKYILSV